MIFKFKLFNFSIENCNLKNYSLDFIYFEINQKSRSLLGISVNKNRFQDRDLWFLGVSLLFFYKRFLIKTILHDYYIRCNCGGLVWKHNRYCPSCGNNEHEKDELTFVYRKPEKYKDEINELKKTGYQHSVEPILDSIFSQLTNKKT